MYSDCECNFAGNNDNNEVVDNEYDKEGEEEEEEDEDEKSNHPEVHQGVDDDEKKDEDEKSNHPEVKGE